MSKVLICNPKYLHEYLEKLLLPVIDKYYSMTSRNVFVRCTWYRYMQFKTSEISFNCILSKFVNKFGNKDSDIIKNLMYKLHWTGFTSCR